MIQRIQSLFLLITAIVAGLMFFMPVASLTIPDESTYAFFTTKVVQVATPPVFIAYNWASMALNAMTFLLPLVIILLYKKRFLQMRLCVVNIILLIGMIVLMWVQVSNMTGETEAGRQLGISFCFPLIGIILTWLALRAIIKDITLLKSFDRIR